MRSKDFATNVPLTKNRIYDLKTGIEAIPVGLGPTELPSWEGLEVG
ncbi:MULTISPECIES: hypothetical protein [Okeania]|nr:MULTISPECIES: hypothetical protein [Okeania]